MAFPASAGRMPNGCTPASRQETCRTCCRVK
jgi:hypothetical protein